MMHSSLLPYSCHALTDIPTKAIKPWLLTVEALANEVSIDWSKRRHQSYKAHIRVPPMLAVICGLPYDDTTFAQVILHAAHALGLCSPYQNRLIDLPGEAIQRCLHCHPEDLVGLTSVGTTTSSQQYHSSQTPADILASSDMSSAYTLSLIHI